MRFGSVCSGIEAASVAWNPLGWKAQWLAEIEPFPCALLKHHYPDTPNLGDMTRYKEWPTDDKHAIDLLCGGTPCQSFSVAGLRKGLDDPRGNLMLTFGAIAAKYRPQWLVWENVPGVLSSNGGADFGAFLGMLGQLGYGFAYRVLDAQYFGVAQRRRRVFVVGCLGDWRSAAAVLFERHSLQGHPAPSRQAGQTITPKIRAGAANGGAGHGARSGDSKDELIVPVARALTTSNQRIDAETETFIATHSLRGEGFDASEDGTGRGTPLVPVAFVQNSRDEVRLMGGDGSLVGSLAAETGAKQQCYVAMPIAFPERMSGTQCASTVNLAPSMGATNPTAIAFNMHKSGTEASSLGISEDRTDCLRAFEKAPFAVQPQPAMAVRRLTPRECERLQGFPDDYTAIPHRNKPAADGPRYKALGNSWAVPNVRWLGERIEAVALVNKAQAAINSVAAMEAA
jgi:DNA (cytosine-5)-methyltransferase 1